MYATSAESIGKFRESFKYKSTLILLKVNKIFTPSEIKL